MGITKFVLKRPVTAVLSILCLIVFGFQSLSGMTLELTPEMDMSMMIIATRYSGASPEDVNELVTKPLEDSVSTLSGLSSISSNSSEGMSMIMLEYEYGTDMDEAYDDLKKKVDMVANMELPEDADTPSIIEMNSNASIDMSLVIDHSGKENLYNYVDNEIIPEFEKLSDAADVSIAGGSEEYIKIELIEEKVKQYGLTMSSIASDIGAANLAYPAGDTSVGSQELSLSTRMKYDTEEALADIPLTTKGNDIVYLSDVAKIYRTSDAGDSIARYNGKDTISVMITKQQSSTSMALSSAVNRVIESLMREDPELNITVVSDNADSITSSLVSVAETLILAIIISMVIIWLPRKKTVVIISALLLAAAFKLAGQLRMELMASDDRGEVSISIETRPGLKTERVDEIVKQVESVIVTHEDLDAYMTTSGGSGMMVGGDASITAYLKDDRKMSTEQVANQWKKELADIPDCNITVDVSGSMSMMSSFGESFETILKGADYDEVKEVTNKIVNELMERPEVTRVHSDVENSSPVIEVTVDGAKAKAYGLSAAAIGNTLYQMVSGIEATELDIDGDTIKVNVEYPEGTYDTLDQVTNIVLSTGTGSSVLLTDVAAVGFKDSPATIRREDKQYIVTISAEYTELADMNTQMKLNQEVVQPNLTETVTTGLNSMDQSMNEEFSAIFGAIATAVFLIFVVMAMQFESPKFSLMVMVTIPFSLIGSFGLLWLADSAISMVSLIGFLMLIGTVVNAGILYVDTVNQYRQTMDRDTALIEAGATRMRPILMTTLTTVIAMIPMAFGWGSSGEMTKGLALVNIGGLTASTILSLLMLPVFYCLFSRKPKQEKVRVEEKECSE